MSKWKTTLDISNSWKLAEERTITPQKLAEEIAIKLNNLRYINDDVEYEKECLIEEFEFFAEETDVTWNDFDSLLRELYDFGDIELDKNWPRTKVCWIKTYF